MDLENVGILKSQSDHNHSKQTDGQKINEVYTDEQLQKGGLLLQDKETDV